MTVRGCPPSAMGFFFGPVVSPSPPEMCLALVILIRFVPRKI